MTKVLVFESDHAFAMELRTQLTELGCTVQVFNDGKRGLMAAASGTNLPDLVLVSVELRSVNGFSICNKFKKHPQLSRVPLVLLSSTSSAETFTQHQQLPTRADAYVHKPLSFEQLLPHIQRLVALGSHSGPLPQPPVKVTQLAGEGEVDAVTVDADRALVAQVRSLDPALMATMPEDDAVATRQARRPRAFSGYASPAQRAFEAQGAVGAPSGQPAPARLPSSQPPSLFDSFMDDDDEQTIVASRQLLEQAEAVATAEAATRAAQTRDPADSAAGEAPRTRDSRRPAVTIPSLSNTGQQWPAAPAGAAHAAEVTSLRQALARTTQQAEHAELELAQLRPLAAETEPLRGQLQNIRQQLTTLNNSLAGYQRQNGELREALQQRDADLLALRDRLASKEREAQQARDSATHAEQSAARMSERLDALETQRSETLAKLQALAADKQLANKRAADFKQGAKKIAEQLNLRSRELSDARSAGEEALRQERKLHAEALRKLEARLRGEISQTEADHQQEIAELQQRHDDEVGAMHSSAEDEQAALLSKREAEWAQERDNLKAALAEAAANVARADDREKQLRQAHQGELTALTTHHDQQLAELSANHDKQLAQLTAEHEQALSAAAAKLSEAAKEHAQALTDASANHQQGVAALEAELADLWQRADQRVDEVNQQLAEVDEQLRQANERISQLQATADGERATLLRAREALAALMDQLAPPAAAPDDEAS